MSKRWTAAALSLLLFFAVGCEKAGPGTASSEPVGAPVSSTEPPAPQTVINPLTGRNDLAPDRVQKRPVAIMINNISVAQSVQCGLGDADIIYETEVEGGITRLLAVFQDVTKASRIGTIRSARYPYIDLAMAHNAIYIHCGADPNYAQPHLKDTDDINIDTNNYGQRIANGKATEHTLYTNGETLWSGLVRDGWKTASTSTAMWQHFASEDETVTLTGGECNTVSVAFSTGNRSSFDYDPATGLYTRKANGAVITDYLSGEPCRVKNVFMLTTSITTYADGVHRKVALDSGSGYYVTNGTYVPVVWSKGSAGSPLKITNTDGSSLTVSAGNSWVCFSDRGTSQPVIG